MITCQIFIDSRQEPADTFIQSTVRYVCLGCIADASLDCSVELPTELLIEIDGDQIFTEELKPGRYRKPLSEILNPPHKPLCGLDFLDRIIPHHHDPVREVPMHFKAIFRDPDCRHRTVATFEYMLVDCAKFRSRMQAAIKMHQPELPEIRLPKRN